MYKRTRSIIIECKKIFTGAAFGLFLIILILIAASNKGVLKSYIERLFLGNKGQVTSYLDDSVSMIGTAYGSVYGSKNDILYKLLGIDEGSLAQLLFSQLPFLGAFDKQKNTQYSLSPIIEQEGGALVPAMSIKNPDAEINEVNVNPTNSNEFVSYNGIYIQNETKYSLDIKSLLESKLGVNLSTKGPQVLILHTHATEAFFPYERSDNDTQNVVMLGAEMKKEFEKQGISVLHITKHHDVPNFNGSYENSLNSVEQAIKKYPSIKVVLDIHRDAYEVNGTKLKVSATINNQKVAQVMLVVGTNEMGLYHPDWQENLKFAIKVQEKLNSLYKGIARPIDLRRERFNQHMSKGYLLIETGAHGNTMQEAVQSARYVTSAIVKVLKSK